jgi:hypothetical protein
VGLTALVVMEPGSDWPGRIGKSVTVVTLGPGEDSLLGRTLVQLESMLQGKQRIRVAFLACNGSLGSSSAEQRAHLAQVLLRSVTCQGHGRLVVCASGDACRELREELLAMVGSLAEEAQGTPTTVTLRFGGTTPFIHQTARVTHA